MSLPVMPYEVVSLFFAITAVCALLLLWEIRKKASACAEALEEIRGNICDIRDKGRTSL